MGTLNVNLVVRALDLLMEGVSATYVDCVSGLRDGKMAVY